MKRLFLTAVSMLVLFFAIPQVSHAQDIRHRNFALDTVFRIGTHLIGLPKVAWDTLRIEFTQTYGGDFAGIRQAIVAPRTTPDYGWLDTLIRNTYLNADDSSNLRDNRGYNFIFIPTRFGAMYHNARAVDNYPWVDLNVQNFGVDTVNIALGSWDSVYSNGLIRSLLMPKDTSAPETMMMQGGRFISTDVFDTSKIPNIYDTLGISKDSAHYLKIVIALRIKSADLSVAMPDSATLLYIDLYHRIRDRQSDTCKCNIYEKFQRLAITKGKYLSAVSGNTIDAITGYPEVTFWIDVRTDSTGPWYDGSHYYHSSILSWFGWPTDSSHCPTGCTAILNSLINVDHHDSVNTVHFPRVAENSDLTYSVVTTRKATVSLMRVRFAQHLLDVLERGDLDAWLHKDFEELFDTNYVSTLLRRRTYRIGVHDEPYLPVYRECQLLATKAQDFLNEYSPNDKRGLFQNPVANFEGWRLFTGDLDTNSTRLKPAHLMARQTSPVKV